MVAQVTTGINCKLKYLGFETVLSRKTEISCESLSSGVDGMGIVEVWISRSGHPYQNKK